MLKQVRHKRFMITATELLSPGMCYWYAQEQRSIVPSGNEDNKHKRPWYIHT
jgi:hypothetical protein